MGIDLRVGSLHVRPVLLEPVSGQGEVDFDLIEESSMRVVTLPDEV